MTVSLQFHCIDIIHVRLRIISECRVHSPTNAIFILKHIKIYIKIHINIAPTCLFLCCLFSVPFCVFVLFYVVFVFVFLCWLYNSHLCC